MALLTLEAEGENTSPRKSSHPSQWVSSANSRVAHSSGPTDLGQAWTWSVSAKTARVWFTCQGRAWGSPEATAYWGEALRWRPPMEVQASYALLVLSVQSWFNQLWLGAGSPAHPSCLGPLLQQEDGFSQAAT